LDQALFHHQVQHACYRFIGRILSRSPRHQVFLAIYLAVGFSLGLSSLFTINPSAAFPFEVSRNGMLELPLILSFFVVSGLRATFNIPHELPANWAFQVTDKLDARHYIAATRKWVATSGLLPLALCVTVLEFAYWPWRDALLHLAFETIVSLVLVQVLFFSFRKVPFTCSYFPGKKNMAILAAVYLYGFTTYSASLVALENWLLLSRFSIGAFLIAGVVSITALSAVRRRRHALLIYEEQSDAELQSLGLN